MLDLTGWIWIWRRHYSGLGGAEGQSFELTQLTLESQTASGLSGLRLGSGRLGVKRIDYADPKGGATVTVDSFGLSGGAREEGDNLAFDASYTLERVAVGEENYGPAELQIGFGNISAAATLRLQQGVREVQRKKLPQQQQGLAMLGMFMEVAPDLLRANPSISIKRLFVKTPHGVIEGGLSLVADGLQLDELGSMQALLRKIDADASIQLPEKLLRRALEMQAREKIREHMEMRKKMGESSDTPSEQEIKALARGMIEDRLEKLMEQGLLVRDGIYLAADAELSGGLVSVNGKTIPIGIGR